MSRKKSRILTEFEYIQQVTLPRFGVSSGEPSAPADREDVYRRITEQVSKQRSRESITIGLKTSRPDLVENFRLSGPLFDSLYRNFGFIFLSVKPDPRLFVELPAITDFFFDADRDDLSFPEPEWISRIKSYSAPPVDPRQTRPGIAVDKDSSDFRIQLSDSLNMINCSPEMQMIADGDVSLGVIDTGVDLNHPAFLGCFRPGDNYRCFVENEIDTPFEFADGIGHGTHVMSIAAGLPWISSDNVQLGGICRHPNLKRFMAKVFPYDDPYANTLSILAALDWLAFYERVDVINLSLGGGLPDGKSALTQAVNACIASGVICAISAGNEGPAEATISAPGDAADAITVGSINKNYNLSTFSSCGDSGGRYPAIANKPDIVMPGENILAAFSGAAGSNRNLPPGQKATEIPFSGTSMAAPHAAAVALLISAIIKKQTGQRQHPEMVKEIIMNISSTEKLQRA